MSLTWSEEHGRDDKRHSVMLTIYEMEVINQAFDGNNWKFSIANKGKRVGWKRLDNILSSRVSLIYNKIAVHPKDSYKYLSAPFKRHSVMITRYEMGLIREAFKADDWKFSIPDKAVISWKRVDKMLWKRNSLIIQKVANNR